MLQKYRSLWKKIATVLVIVWQIVLIGINRYGQMWRHPLNLLLSLLYIALLCATLFIFGKSRLFLICLSIGWGIGLLSYLGIQFLDRNMLFVIALLIFYIISAPLIGTFECLQAKFSSLIWPEWLTILSFVLVYALLWTFYLFGKHYEKRKGNEG